jgi:hypothetical protein
MSTVVGTRWAARFVQVLVAPATWLERSRGRKRRRLLMLSALVAAFAGFWVWWATSLRKLPDLGDPFDVAAFEAERVRADENAFTLYRPAVARLMKSAAAHHSDTLWRAAHGGWGKASPEVRKLVDENREVLETWRRATERPRAGRQPQEDRLVFRTAARSALVSLACMAMLEGSRLEDQGDMAGAWEWYNATLRASRHVGMRSGSRERLLGYGMLIDLGDRAVSWARDARVDATALRRALADVQAAAAMSGSAADTFKSDYVHLMWAFDHPESWVESVQGGYHILPPRAFEAVAFLKREPERSRRIARLIFAHWLDQCERPRAARPPMTTDVTLKFWGTPHRYPDFPYSDPPHGLDARHPLTAERLAGGMSSALYVNTLMPPLQIAMDSIDQERSRWGVMIVTFAEQLYEREHGQPPPSPEALVGPYLPSLPEGYAAPATPGAPSARRRR